MGAGPRRSELSGAQAALAAKQVESDFLRKQLVKEAAEAARAQERERKSEKKAKEAREREVRAGPGDPGRPHPPSPATPSAGEKQGQPFGDLSLANRSVARHLPTVR